jgi:hypothetical protein
MEYQRNRTATPEIDEGVDKRAKRATLRRPGRVPFAPVAPQPGAYQLPALPLMRGKSADAGAELFQGSRPGGHRPPGFGLLSEVKDLPRIGVAEPVITRALGQSPRLCP